MSHAYRQKSPTAGPARRNSNSNSHVKTGHTFKPKAAAQVDHDVGTVFKVCGDAAANGSSRSQSQSQEEQQEL